MDGSVGLLRRCLSRLSPEIFHNYHENESPWRTHARIFLCWVYPQVWKHTQLSESPANRQELVNCCLMGLVISMAQKKLL